MVTFYLAYELIHDATLNISSRLFYLNVPLLFA
ncbi:unnamed protein product [Schistosoma curassoni]|uniref:Uncharacterized protein n=1 Tax=Schistosoma curassoni TaxID=6186 RepID=A0A183K6Y9_9TREM|nr:unnamed protein product [Schistosoma curassoni]